MSYTISIKNNETNATETVECNAFFAGWASKEFSGGMSCSSGDGLCMCLAANNAEDEIKKTEKKIKAFAMARQYLAEHESEIISKKTFCEQESEGL